MRASPWCTSWFAGTSVQARGGVRDALARQIGAACIRPVLTVLVCLGCTGLVGAHAHTTARAHTHTHKRWLHPDLSNGS